MISKLGFGKDGVRAMKAEDFDKFYALKQELEDRIL